MIALPLVSVIIAAYNAEKYIESALDSILAQTYSNLEIIVVDDGSLDSTGKLLKRYIPKGVTVFTQENKGQNAALNFGYSRSAGSLIKFMDADDLINEQCIAIQTEALKDKPDSIAYGEWARFFNDDPSTARFTPKPYWKDMLPIDFLTSDAAGPMLQCGIMLVPRTLLDKAGLWDTRLLLANDTELYTRILLKSVGTVFTQGARLYYRSGIKGSLSNQKSRRFFEATFLGTNLIAEHLLPVENSDRTRKLIANLLQQRLYEMYPCFPDLEKLHKDEIIKMGGSTLIYKSGKIFNLLRRMVGWKIALRIKNLFHGLGYSPSQAIYK
ncbi:MAG: glycosyltransferase family 2 protein [Bacteroidales bacterium]